MAKTPSRLPADFEGSGVTLGHKVGKQVWHAACPNCGGEDRVFLLLKSKATGSPFAQCRNHLICGFTWWQGKNTKAPRLTDEELAAIAAERAADEARLAAETAARLAKLQDEHPWREYVENMTPAARRYWTAQGISPEWMAIWQLGWVPERHYRDAQDKPMTCSAHSIPKFAIKPVQTFDELECRNIDFRLTASVAGRYRPLPELPATFFCSHTNFDLSSPPVNTVFLVEGSKKAMVVSRKLSEYFRHEVLVAGYPSQNSWGDVDELASHFEKVFILPDPDSIASGWADALAIACGGRLVELPEKPDDMLVLYGVSTKDFVATFRSAREPRKVR